MNILDPIFLTFVLFLVAWIVVSESQVFQNSV